MTLPLGKVTVILLYNAFHFSKSTHKRLHIRITVLFQNIGQLIQLGGDVLFRPLYLLGNRFTLFALENPFCIGKLRFQFRKNIVLQMTDFFCSLLRLYHQTSHMAKLCYINIKSRLGRHIFFSDNALQKIFCLCHNPTEQIRQPAFAFDRLACFFVYLGLLDF